MLPLTREEWRVGPVKFLATNSPESPAQAFERFSAQTGDAGMQSKWKAKNQGVYQGVRRD